MTFVVFKLGTAIFTPDDKDHKDRLMYTTWTQKQFEAEEEEDDDD